MAYIDTFQTAKPTPPPRHEDDIPTADEVAIYVGCAIGTLPAQSVHVWRADELAADADRYADADEFEREVMWPGIQHGVGMMLLLSCRLQSLPHFVPERAGEDSDAYLDRCYAASGFVPSSGRWSR